MVYKIINDRYIGQKQPIKMREKESAQSQDTAAEKGRNPVTLYDLNTTDQGLIEHRDQPKQIKARCS